MFFWNADNCEITKNNITDNDIDGLWFSSDSNNNTISGNKITGNNLDGIYLFECSNNSIFGNEIANNSYGGIGLSDSSDNNIFGNNIIANSNIAINIRNSSYNSIAGNKIAYSGFGILLSSSNNNITANTIESNSYGIYFSPISFQTGELPSNNHIYNNNFITNTKNVYFSSFFGSVSSPNTWDGGYPSGGNYWSDYDGVDSHSGPDQNETGSDGIGDAPYVIDENNTDRYPLIHPWAELLGDINDDGIVDIYDAILLGICFNSTPDDPDWNPNADFNGDGLIDIYDAIMLATNFGKTS
jgi:parallel beta-helix repeat protein